MRSGARDVDSLSYCSAYNGIAVNYTCYPVHHVHFTMYIIYIVQRASYTLYSVHHVDCTTCIICTLYIVQCITMSILGI